LSRSSIEFCGDGIDVDCCPNLNGQWAGRPAWRVIDSRFGPEYGPSDSPRDGRPPDPLRTRTAQRRVHWRDDAAIVEASDCVRRSPYTALSLLNSELKQEQRRLRGMAKGATVEYAERMQREVVIAMSGHHAKSG
jgi:hypothetical protein